MSLRIGEADAARNLFSPTKKLVINLVKVRVEKGFEANLTMPNVPATAPRALTMDP